MLFDHMSRQLCAKTDHARRVRIFQTFRHLLKRIVGEKCIPEFAQEGDENIRAV